MRDLNIPLLTAEDIECRVQSVKKNRNGNVGAVLLLYKDARVDMRILDQVVGPGQWQRTHEVINGNLFCNIDIWDDEKQAWVRKQDVGTEGNTEKEKSQASDSFKRAGTNWGIGRELYTAPFIYVLLDSDEYYGGDQQGSSIKCSPSTVFRVVHVAYNERREISGLIIEDRNGRVRFGMDGQSKGYPPTENPPTGSPPKQMQQKKPETEWQNRGEQNAGACPICKGPITGAERGYSRKRYGTEMCRSCQKSAAS